MLRKLRASGEEREKQFLQVAILLFRARLTLPGKLIQEPHKRWGVLPSLDEHGETAEKDFYILHVYVGLVVLQQRTPTLILVYSI